MKKNIYDWLNEIINAEKEEKHSMKINPSEKLWKEKYSIDSYYIFYSHVRMEYFIISGTVNNVCESIPYDVFKNLNLTPNLLKETRFQEYHIRRIVQECIRLCIVPHPCEELIYRIDI